MIRERTELTGLEDSTALKPRKRKNSSQIKIIIFSSDVKKFSDLEAYIPNCIYWKGILSRSKQNELRERERNKTKSADKFIYIHHYLRIVETPGMHHFLNDVLQDHIYIWQAFTIIKCVPTAQYVQVLCPCDQLMKQGF